VYFAIWDCLCHLPTGPWAWATQPNHMDCSLIAEFLAVGLGSSSAISIWLCTQKPTDSEHASSCETKSTSSTGATRKKNPPRAPLSKAQRRGSVLLRRPSAKSGSTFNRRWHRRDARDFCRFGPIQSGLAAMRSIKIAPQCGASRARICSGSPWSRVSALLRMALV